jgi:galactokinase
VAAGPAVARARAAFAERMGRAPRHVVRAPGRIELLGNHTDYNEGLVLSAAIDRDLALAVAPRDDGLVRIASSDQPDEALFAPAPESFAGLAPWAQYPAAVLLKLRERGVDVPGFDGLVASDVPVGSGLSSSAALEVATALAVRALRPYRLADGAGELDEAERWQLAHLCRAAERDLVGVPCGLLDQVSVLFGAPEAALLIDCRAPSVERLPFRDVGLVVADSGKRHELTAGHYGEIAAACASAARALGVRALRDATPGDLLRDADRLSARDADCARHVVTEIERVARGAGALRAADLTTFGRLMAESHASSRDLLRNSTPELDLLVALALALPGCLGARLTGGGFGGATVSLTHAERAETLALELAEHFRARSARAIATWRLRPAAGAAVVAGA